MRGFFKPEDANMEIGLTTVDYVDFSKVDSRIKHTGGWAESYPMQTAVSFPKENADEIIAKLKLHNEITSVNGEQTARGIAVQEEMRKRFESLRPGK